jgi:NTE family protein
MTNSTDQNELNTNQPIAISLVLGSGGARGLTHIGVIRYLLEQGYRIDSIAGSSIGALVGGMYALGKLDEFAEWVSASNTVDMFRLMDFTLSSAGLVKGDRIIETLKGLTGESLIEDLPIPFTAVASDVINEKEVWLSRGPLFDAIRASIAIPLFFAPAEVAGVQLLDGGVLNPVPIAPTFRDHTDLTIAVNLSGASNSDWPKAPAHDSDEKEQQSFFSRKIEQFVDSIRSPVQRGELNGMYDVAAQAIDTMEGAIARHKLATYPPDILIEIPRNLCTVLEFDRGAELIAAGYELAREQMAQVSPDLRPTQLSSHKEPPASS